LYSSGTGGQVAEHEGKASTSSFIVSQSPLSPHLIFLPADPMAAFFIPKPSAHPKIQTFRPSGQCQLPCSTTGGSPQFLAKPLPINPKDKYITRFILFVSTMNYGF